MGGRDRRGSPLSIVIDTARRIWTHPENRGRRVRRLARWIGWQVWERSVRRPWTVPFHGDLRMICHPHDTVTSLVLYYGLYDAEEMRFLLAWLRSGETFVDVGANVGPYSLLSTLAPDVRTLAFEPFSLAQQRFRANIELNGVGHRVHLVPRAVGEGDRSGRLSADRWATNELVGDRYDGATEEVEIVSLDSYDAASPLGQVGLMKVDVEGHELAVLRGAARVVRRDRPALIVELNDVSALRNWAETTVYTAVRYLAGPVAGALEPRPWPTEPGGNMVLVPDLDAARHRVAATTRRS